uniref:RIN4 pathogenic type III effector avirulence factor Avr cleavage site domain-containing protein n=1 Tax=Oryza punctata TaxID=4537 RepID=A0A0E0KVE5_ORYPU
MTTADKGRPLPKFGEWDVNNPASAEGFTVIFQKARDDKKTAGPGNAKVGIPPAFRNTDDGGYRPEFKPAESYQQHTPPKRVKKKWAFCAGC